MIDVQKILGQVLGAGSQGQGGYGRPQPGLRPGSKGGIEGQIGDFLRGPGGTALKGALASGLAGRLFRSRGLGRMGGSTMKLGGLALVAGLAYKAYESYQSNRSTGAPSRRPVFASESDLPQAAGTRFLPRGEEDRRARLILSAMIAAAKADGYIDAEEERAIFGQLDEAGLDPEERDFLRDEMKRPMSIDDLVAAARSSEEAVEVYTASLLAIDPDHPAERAYLDLLAARLNLDPALVAEIRQHADAAAV